MIIDSAELQDRDRLDGDIAIVGAGAAGITLARELEATGLAVAVIESGGLTPTAQTQTLNAGVVDFNFGKYPLASARLRQLGGTTGHWAGHCHPLDPIDLEYRPWVPNSGWPIDYDELVPYYMPACQVCEIDYADFSVQRWADKQRPILDLDPNRLRSQIVQQSPPTRFGTVYRSELASSETVNVYLNLTALRVSGSNDGAGVREVVAVTPAGSSLRVHARYVVLAAGAIQNARLLLFSDRLEPGTAGSGGANVGRFFMEHFRVNLGVMAVTNPLANLSLYLEKFRRTASGSLGHAMLVPGREASQERELLNAFIRIDRGSGLALREAGRRVRAAGAELQEGQVFAALGDLAGGITDAAHAAYMRGWRESRVYRPHILEFHLEQPPYEDNRVTLIDSLDSNGMPLVHVRCHIGELERRCADAIFKLLAESIGSGGIGRLRRFPDSNNGWPSYGRGLIGSWHHMGTTRMSATPANGVVDRNCRVHGVPNLFVAGSAVFPTGGVTMPTLTSVALSIRLAGYLKESLA